MSGDDFHFGGNSGQLASIWPEDIGSTSSRAPIGGIICDVGDVLILFDQEVSAEMECRYQLQPGQLLKATLKSEAGRLATVGAISTDRWYEMVADSLPAHAIDEWLAYHGDLNTALVELLLAARSAGIIVCLLSNATSRLWDDLRHHQIESLGDHVVCSADVGLAKPDPQIYHHALAVLGMAAGEVVYLDDTEPWVEAGRSIGLRAHHYVGIGEARNALVAEGLKL